MKRETFKQIIKLRSVWKVSKKDGNYKFPSGEPLTEYLKNLVYSQAELDHLAITESGDLAYSEGGKWNDSTKDFEPYTIKPDFGDDETCSFEEQEKRVNRLVSELVF